MSWAAQEFEGLELGDARRTQRLIQLVDDLSTQPAGSIPLACGSWAETKAASGCWTIRRWSGGRF